MPIQVLLVDDEYLALNLLEGFVSQVPDLEIVGKAKSPMRALEILGETKVDLMFLDIQMPTLSGVNLLKTLKNPPVVIFTTAYSDYAIQAFDLNAIDYLLKPFSFERFLQAVNKAREQLMAQMRATTLPGTVSGSIPFEPAGQLTVKVDGKLVRIDLADILFIEGLKEYVRIVCPNNQRYVTLESLKNLEDMLPAEGFVRVHKSYIVARPKVRALDGNQLEIASYKIPISRSKREEIVALLFPRNP